MKLIQGKMLLKLVHLNERAKIPSLLYFSSYISNGITVSYSQELIKMLGLSMSEYKNLCSNQFLFEIMTPEDSFELSYFIFKFYADTLSGSSMLLSKRVRVPRKNGNICWATIKLYCHKGQCILQNIFISSLCDIIESNEHLEPLLDGEVESIKDYSVLAVTRNMTPKSL